MLDMVEVFDVLQADQSGKAVWTGLTGTRTALLRDGYVVDPTAMAYCPREWVDERGYLDADLARKHPRPWSI
ncbi:hypothetical protein [Bradyrhizobium commune]|uniref:Uncharacterized protein n=1 Tax=Bradyrhizobium commune TaxID=83627 RepID=A0A7S9GX09_9BRAD|nr:hypothetical protein [Bradyrhizobium commune]QPF88903.1 hypothetical protein IC761_20515 [Bradyrhizobium commune]